MNFIGSSVGSEGKESFESVQTWAEDTQHRFGDRLSSEHVSKLPIEPRVNMKQNTWTELITFWRQLSDEDQGQFRQKYGDVADLLFVPIEESLVKAILRFWDPSHRCFTFNHHDMVPTLEEYTLMMGIGHEQPDKIYSRKPKLNAKKKLSKMLGIDVESLKPYWREKGKDRWCFVWDYLKDYIASHLHEGLGRRALALAVYGLVVFPRALGHIEEMVVDLVEMMQHGYNPVTAVLAETIRSLNYCRQHPGSRFSGCLPLLYVWIKSHFKCNEKHFAKSFRKGQPVQEFCKSRWPEPKSESWWVCHLHNLRSDEIEWFSPWMRHVSVLFRCGGELEVPLLGLWGMVSYCPLQALRQYGCKQFIPVTHGLGKKDEDYSKLDALTRLTHWVLEWKQTHRMSFGTLSSMITPAYGIWRGKKVENQVPPLETMLAPPEKPQPTESTPLEIAQSKFAAEIERLKQENIELRENNEKLRLEMRDKRFELRRATNDTDDAKTNLKGFEEENRKLWLEIQKFKKRKAPGTDQREKDQMQEQIEYWKQQASTSQGKAVYWQEQHATSARKLAKSEEKLKEYRTRGSQEYLQQRVQVIESQMKEQRKRYERLIADWQNHDMQQKGQLQEAMQWIEAWKVEAGDRQHIINRMMEQVRMVAEEAKKMAGETEKLLYDFCPMNEMGLKIANYLNEAKRQYYIVTHLYGRN